MDWGEIDRGEWEAHAATAPLQQTWLWGEVLAASGARIERRAVRDASGTVRGLAQVATRRVAPVSVSLLSRGPVWPGGLPQGLGGLAASLARAGLRLLVVTPEAGRLAGAIPVVTPAHHAELDITPPLDDLRRGLKGKFRNMVSRGEREGLTIRREDKHPDRYAWLIETEAAQQRARRYRNWPPALVPLWHARGGEVRTFVACQGGARVAAMLFLVHGHVATYQIGWSGAEGRRSGAHPLCLWHAVRHLRHAGVRRIDLGTVNTVDTPGLARFKIATGAQVRPLGATFLVLPGTGRGATCELAPGRVRPADARASASASSE